MSIAEKLRKMTVANGCTEAEASVAAVKLKKLKEREDYCDELDLMAMARDFGVDIESLRPKRRKRK
jgi:hypothetical protein